MVEMYPLSLVVALAILLYYFLVTARVGAARGKYGVSAPACEGPDEFNRIFRVQQNTMEQLVLFLPLMSLFAIIGGDLQAGVVGLLWLVGRVLYARAYVRDPATRGLGMWLTAIASAASFLGIIVYAVLRLF
ncbi:MAG: MAPEG family protein [Pseudomonadota bacterium]